MKTQDSTYSKRMRYLILAVAVLLAFPLRGQSDEKVRLRIGAVYTKIMDGPLYLDLQTSARIDRSNVSVPDADLEVYYEVDGEEFPLGKVRTDRDGKARLTIDGIGSLRPDSTGLYILGASFGGNDAFLRASRTVEFRDGNIRASLVERDSLPHVTAVLTDAALDSTVADALIRVQVARMFRPLRVSEEFLMTDEDGSILVPVPTDIPGPDGNLTLEVVIQDNETYGTVKAMLEAPVGTTAVAATDFDQRTLWAPRDRTPLFILFFTGVLILGSWGLIVYLIVNLFKIAKN